MVKELLGSEAGVEPHEVEVLYVLVEEARPRGAHVGVLFEVIAQDDPRGNSAHKLDELIFEDLLVFGVIFGVDHQPAQDAQHVLG